MKAQLQWIRDCVRDSSGNPFLAAERSGAVKKIAAKSPTAHRVLLWKLMLPAPARPYFFNHHTISNKKCYI
jgi:3-oxoacyl-ACP reductase-like protein